MLVSILREGVTRVKTEITVSKSFAGIGRVLSRFNNFVPKSVMSSKLYTHCAVLNYFENVPNVNPPLSLSFLIRSLLAPFKQING